jgi:DNA-binding transcriptional regulator YiaG
MACNAAILRSRDLSEDGMSSALARKLESLRVKGAMRDAEVANLLRTGPETVSRWDEGRAYPEANTEKRW